MANIHSFNWTENVSINPPPLNSNTHSFKPESGAVFPEWLKYISFILWLFIVHVSVKNQTAQKLWSACLGKDVRVVLPDSAIRNFPPFWTKNNHTGELSGYFVDVLREIFRHTGMTYTMADNSNFTSYSLLSITHPLHME